MAKHGTPSEIGALPTSATISPSGRNDVAGLVAEIPDLDAAQLCLRWRNHLGGTVPAHLPRWLLARVLGYRLQAAAHGDFDRSMLRRLRLSGRGSEGAEPFATREPATRDGASLRPGGLLVREWKGQMQHVMVLEDGFAWSGATYASLSRVARAITGTSWNGHRFFGLRKAADAK